MLLRAAPAFRAATANARRYATGPTGAAPKSANWSLYLAGAGAAGLGAYLYIEGRPGALRAQDAVVEAAKPKATNTESPLSAKEFVDFKLKKVDAYNYNTDRYVFELPNGDASRLPVASCVLFKGPDSLKDAKGNPVVRPYTPTSASDEPGILEFVVKRYEGGLMSQYMHGLKPGDSLAIKGPFPKIPIKPNDFDHVGMIAGGSGITPMWQILQHTLNDPENKTKFTLLFGNVEERDILLRDEFEMMAKKYPDTFKIVHVLDKAPSNWPTPAGYITRDTITQHIAGPEGGERVKVLVCGPPGQVAAVAGQKDGMKQGALGGVLKELGYKEDQVFKF